MATAKQVTGEFGERSVTNFCSCPRCKREKRLVRLPTNFKCADVICDFCGFLGQVKTSNKNDISTLPKSILGAAWGPQNDRMTSGIYFPLFIVLTNSEDQFGIFYLSADLQRREMFKPRTPLSPSAKRAGWQGYLLDIDSVRERIVRIR
jgi:hypothetical protein